MTPRRVAGYPPQRSPFDVEELLFSLEQFRDNAAVCIRLAEEARTPAQRSLFVEMAERWLRLAEQAQTRSG